MFCSLNKIGRRKSDQFSENHNIQNWSSKDHGRTNKIVRRHNIICWTRRMKGQLHLRKTDLKNSTLLLRSREIEESLRKGSIEDSARGRTLHVEDSARRKQKIVN